MNVPMQQQNYISTNYTHAARDLMANGINVLAQHGRHPRSGWRTWFSLGSNPDVTLDLLPLVAEARRQGRADGDHRRGQPRNAVHVQRRDGAAR
jgi:hypothetical protein